MSYRRLAEAVLSALPAGLFSAVVVGDEVTHGKPHPEPYLKAVAALAAPAQRCVVIEDSVLGVASGEAAGCVVLAVPHKVPIAPGPRRTIVDSLTEVGLDSLEVLVSRAAKAESPG
jgi:beta-phosphoglucomutase-like phosphatase (HAD superfamily)